MGKATIIEAQNSNTVYEQGSSKGILGKLKGVFADYKNGTRNADRLYTEELWDNRVFGSEDVMEALETKTLFGELDHPEGDRCETLAKNAAISITKLEKRPDEGVIYGEAEILDTPTGRIVKALADSGAKLGISSRGMGEEIYKEGKNIIDPETYDFITFDVVVTPANTKARVTLTESKKLSQLTESLQKEIESCETVNQLSQVKTVLETMNTSNKEDLIKTVESKINSLNENKKQSNILSEKNKQIALDLLKTKYTEQAEQLKESLNANESLASENNKLIEENEFYKNSRETIKTKLKEAKENENNLKTQLEESNKQITDLNTKLEESNKKLESNKVEENKEQLEESKVNETIIKMKQINEKKIENLQIKHNEDITRIQEESNKKDIKINNLLEANKKLSENIESMSKILSENKNLKIQLQKLQEEKDLNIKKLQEGKILENNKIKQLEAKIKQLEAENAESKTLEERFSKLAFSPLGTVKAIKENFENPNYSQEDQDLFNILTGK